MQKVNARDLLEAGVHFGHQTKRWNPKMKNYVYGEKNGIYIIDLTKTIRQIYEACNYLQKIVAEGGNILFVGTKRQAQESIKAASEKTKMFHVTERWLGGTLTNNTTIQKSIEKMKEFEKIIENESEHAGMKKKELVKLKREHEKLKKNLDGIRNMKNLPEALVVVDVCHDDIAVKEARKLDIPIVAIVDTNADPETVDYPIVANDDAVRSIKIIIDTIAEAIFSSMEIYSKRLAEEAQELKDNPPAKDEASNNESSSKDRRKAPARKRSDSPARPRRPGQGRTDSAQKPRAPRKETPKSDTVKKTAAKSTEKTEKTKEKTVGE